MKMETRIIDYLESTLIAINDIMEYSNKPGIYAVGYLGANFPLDGTTKYFNQHRIIYIGKTESNQLKRDKNTHFASGKTGQSTLRRSLGAILKNQLNLIPIPRSITEISDRRFTNYKFDNQGEENLSKWMIENLSLAFWELVAGKNELRVTEKSIIKFYVPLLNIIHNGQNPFLKALKELRKECKYIARQC